MNDANLRAVQAIVLSAAGDVVVDLLVEQIERRVDLEIDMDLIVVLGLSLGLVDLVQVRYLLVAVAFRVLLRAFLLRHDVTIFLFFHNL